MILRYIKNRYTEALQKLYIEIKSISAEQSKAVQERYSGSEQQISV